MGKKAVVVGYGDVGKGSAQSLRQEGMIFNVNEIDPICAMQACLDGFEVVSTIKDCDATKGINTELLESTDMLVTSTGNYNVCDADVLAALKSGCVVCNIGHFDNEIDTAFMRDKWEWDEIKPQVHKIYRNKEKNDHLLLLAEGRLVNLGNATGHPSRIMDGSFANQVLAQIELFGRKFADKNSDAKSKALQVEILPKHLDEEVAKCMVIGFGGVMTKLSQEQADYIGVKKEGPYKPEDYRY
jgi:adenosylhomocysteinase